MGNLNGYKKHLISLGVMPLRQQRQSIVQADELAGRCVIPAPRLGEEDQYYVALSPTEISG
jgi:hypothetical protein